MDGDSSSGDTTASSVPRCYVCTICFRVFPSGQALGGHQNAHQYERSLRKNIPNILGAVLNHPLPDDDDDDDDDLALTGSNFSGQHPSSGTSPGLNMQADGSQTEKGKGAQNPVDQSKVKNGYHPYQKPVEEETRRKLLTKNLLGELKPVHQLKEGEGEGEREREGLEKNSSGVDLELSLKRKECLDLELKLGF